MRSSCVILSFLGSARQCREAEPQGQCVPGRTTSFNDVWKLVVAKEFAFMIHFPTRTHWREVRQGTRTLARVVPPSQAGRQGLPPRVRPTAAVGAGAGRRVGRPARPAPVLGLPAPPLEHDHPAAVEAPQEAQARADLHGVGYSSSTARLRPHTRGSLTMSLCRPSSGFDHQRPAMPITGLTSPSTPFIGATIMPATPVLPKLTKAPGSTSVAKS